MISRFVPHTESFLMFRRWSENGIAWLIALCSGWNTVVLEASNSAIVFSGQCGGLQPRDKARNKQFPSPRTRSGSRPCWNRKGLSTSYLVFGAEGGLGSMSCGIGMSGILVPGRVTKWGLGVQAPYCQNNAKIMSLCCGCEHNMTVHVKHTLPSRSLLLNSALVYDFLKCLKTQEWNFMWSIAHICI